MVIRSRERKLCAAMIFLASLGWLVYVVGFGWLNVYFYNELSEGKHRVHPNWFPFWCFAVTGPVLDVLLSIHQSYLNRITSYCSRICTALYLVSGGGVLYFDGVLISTVNENSGGGEPGTSQYMAGGYLVAEFTGCLISMVFMTIYTALWVDGVERYARQQSWPYRSVDSSSDPVVLANPTAATYTSTACQPRHTAAAPSPLPTAPPLYQSFK